jgi:hypothetical protein
VDGGHPRVDYHDRVRRPAWAVLVVSIALTVGAAFAPAPMAAEWAFEETFDALAPDAPSQSLIPHAFDFVVTHQTHPKTPDGFDDGGSYGTFPADHGADCSAPPNQHAIVATTHRSNAAAPDATFYVCNGHLMSAMGEVEGYSSTAFWPRQEFEFAGGGVLEWAVNLSAPHERSWWEIQIMPRQQLQAAAIKEWLGADETYPAQRIVLEFTSDSTRHIQVGSGDMVVEKDKWPGWLKSHDGDPALTDRRIRRQMRLELQGNALAWGIEQEDGAFDWLRTDLPDGLPFTRGLVLFTTHAYTPEKDGNNDRYTFHWDDIRFSGPRLPMYDVYEADDVVNLQSSAGASIGSSSTQVVTLPRVDHNPVLFGQVHSGLQGQVRLRVNGGPEVAVEPHNQAAKNGSCHFGTWRSFRIPLAPGQLHVGDNTLQWTVGPRPACAAGEWWWDGFNIKGVEIQLDP